MKKKRMKRLTFADFDKNEQHKHKKHKEI